VNVTVNGKPATMADGATVADVVLAVTGVAQPRGVAVARCGAVVPRSAWPGTALVEGDRVEVLTATQGG
jgi:sulfur carrier protein